MRQRRFNWRIVVVIIAIATISLPFVRKAHAEKLHDDCTIYEIVYLMKHFEANGDICHCEGGDRNDGDCKFHETDRCVEIECTSGLIR